MDMRVFAVGAHPDDIEFGMAGTMLLLREKGCELHYMTLANGCCGSNRMDAAETARVRGAESRAAADALGAAYHGPIANDVEVFYNKELLSRMISIVREIKPAILLVPSLFDYMEDHVYTARLAVMAGFCRGMPNAPCDPPMEIYGDPVAVYHAQPHGHRDSMGAFRKPDFLVGVDSVIDAKTRALAKHESQRSWLNDSQAMDAYLLTMHAFSREMGCLTAGRCEFAEGWSRHNYLGFCERDCDPMADVLGERALLPPAS